MDISVSIRGPGTKELMNQGDFHADGDSILLLKGVSPNLENKPSTKPVIRIMVMRKQDVAYICLSRHG